MATSNGSPSTDFNTFHNVIDGKLSSTEKTLCTLDPSTLESLPQVPVSTAEDVNRAVEAAQRAAAIWAAVPWDERVRAIENYAAAVEVHIDELGQLLLKEQGKPITWAKNEVNVFVMSLRGFCKLSLPEEILEETADRKVTKQYTPLGVVVGIVPWNYPLQMASQKLAPALLTGNAFILKPSPRGPYCALKVVEIAQPFFPPGLLQVLSGDDSLGPLLTEHPGVHMVGFTGSTEAGKQVMVACSKTVKRFYLELGGNDAAVVCADADPVTAGTMIALIAFFNTGQICIAIKRVYVHEAIYDAVLATIAGFAQQAKIGLDAADFTGPLSNKAQFDFVNELFEDSKATGQKIVCGGVKPEMGGYFMAPVVVDNPPDDSRVVVEEQFGPILPVMKWTDEADVIHRVNDTDTGLGASVWSRDLVQAERIARQLEAGNVWVNTHGEIAPKFPFQGLKQSGLGAGMGIDGLKMYCNSKTLSVGIKSVYEAFLNAS